MNIATLRVPASVIASTAFVVEHAKQVQVDDTALASLVDPIRERLAQGIDSVEDAFGTTGSLEGDVNLIFLETATNFCFWSQTSDQKWKTDFEGTQIGGWYGLSRAFYKAVKQGIPVQDSAYMERLTIAQAEELFAGVGGQRIPLLEQRVNNLVEAARFLNEHYGGSAYAFLKDCDMSAPKIAEAVVRHLPSYRDGAWYGDQWVWILKRAQILPNDLSQLQQKYPNFTIKDVDQLTAFADYRIPQVLREYGILRYSDKLAQQLDTMAILPSQSAAEVEIRAATIIACERIKQLAGDLSAADIDLALWLLSKDLRKKPAVPSHHLTISTYY